MKNIILRSISKRIIPFILILVLVVTFNGCNKNNNGKVKVRIGYFPNVTHMQAVVGLSDNFFQDYLGKDIEIDKRTFNAGPAEMEAFMANQIDIGYIGPIPAINCFSKTAGEVKIISGACNGGALLLTGKDSGIKSFEELSGKKIAVPQFGNTQDILLRQILKNNKLGTVDKGGTVTIIQSENANIMTLMERKHIDAALVPEPWGTLISKRLNANILLNSEQVFNGNKYSTTVVIVRKKFLQEHQEIVKKWIDAHRIITKNIMDNKSLYIEKFSQEINRMTGQNVDKEEIMNSINNIELSCDIPSLSLKSYIEFLKEANIINDTNLNDLIDDRFIK